MRLALLAVVTTACSSKTPSPTPPPQNTTTPQTRISTDLGRLVIVTASARTDTTPGFVPINTQFPVVDPASRVSASTETSLRVVDARGASGTFTLIEPTEILYGCDGNKLTVTPLTGTTKLTPGIAWALSEAAVRPSARAPIVRSDANAATYGFGDLVVTVQRDPQKKDRGTLRFVVNDHEAGAIAFERTLMDGADPSMATLDIHEGGPAIPVALAAWSIDGSGNRPYLVALERPGWEGTSIEGWLVDARSATQLTPLATYLYQCAF